MGVPKVSEADEHELTEEEITFKRDAALLRALSTPHKKQADMKLGKSMVPVVAGVSPRKRGTGKQIPKGKT